ncbi:unnamed protein product [Microthlaspi erraticum]|uniref:Uncharacterized protein n=1 Tax=Microthlaspi erraticum TaxID=1685480 RepID=A0A6D2JEG2_9BRAS|nr:unnamed protein product [Microthlaspi erraticum]
MDQDFESSNFISNMIQIITLVRSMDPKPESSELTSLVTRTISVLDSMDLASQPKPLLSELISLVTQIINLNSEAMLLVPQVLALEPELELISLLSQIITLMNPDSQWRKLIPPATTSTHPILWIRSRSRSRSSSHSFVA